MQTRQFSSHPSRRKEAPKDDEAEPEEKDESQTKAEKLEGELEQAPRTEDAAEAKKDSSVPDPIPQPDGKVAAGSGGTGDSGPGSGSSNDGGKGRGRKPSIERQLSKPTVPEHYPQVMAIPIAKRPLFPGFYKAITIRDRNVVDAINEMIKRGQPYVGAFLFKDETADKDIIEKLDDVHDVGVFAQITSAFPVHGDEHSLTAVLYPHRRIKMTALMPPSVTHQGGSAPPMVEVQELKDDKPKPETASGDVVASFEEPNKDQPSQLAIYEPTSFLSTLR